MLKYLDLERFKVEQCQISSQHNHKHCKNYHTIKDRRRSKNGEYSPDLCKHQETDKCPSGDHCKLSHNRVERLYHIEKYKTKFCTKFPKDLQACDYGEYCSFAHSQKDIKTRLIHNMKKD